MFSLLECTPNHSAQKYTIEGADPRVRDQPARARLAADEPVIGETQRCAQARRKAGDKHNPVNLPDQ